MASSPFTLRATGGAESGESLVRAAEVRAAMSVLADPNYGVQIQSLPGARWKTCRGDDPAEVARAAAELAPGCRGVYFTLHPCPNDLGHAQNNASAVYRRWLLVDLDRAQPATTNSTDAEHEAARAVAYQIHHDLSEVGWPTPLVNDSGNGWHLLYRIDLPNDDASKELVKACLVALGNRYDTEEVAIDRRVYDARRICKLPGTLARKGPSTPDRPHRWARVALCPEEIEVVTAAQLGRLAGGKAEAPKATAAPPSPPSDFVLRAGGDRKRAYAERALESEVAKVVLSPVGGRNDALNKAAFVAGQLVGAKALLRQKAEADLTHAALANGLEEGETKKTVKSGLDAGVAQPRDLSFLESPANGKHAAPSRPAPDPVIWKMGDLMRATFPPARWAVPGILSEGLSILAGKPKLGKSWMALNLALTIAAGGKALGSIQTVAGDVLYLSLEDRLRRVQDRAKKVLRGLDSPEASDRLSVAVEWPRQDKGGLAFLRRWLDKADGPRLVIIDVLAKFRTASTGRRNAYDEDYEILSEIKKLVDEFHCSALALMHCKKGKAEDVIEEVSGTLGGAGCADGVTVLARSRGEYEAVLHITGRDVEEQKLALSFDPRTCCWSSLGSADEVYLGRLQTAVLAYLKGLGRATFVKDIADHLGDTPDKIRPVLHRLFDRGLIRHVGNAWAWPGDEALGEAERF